MMSKQSIRFYNDHEVRAIWDEEHSKWWFLLDIVGAINNQENYQKNRNYWKYLKTKLKKENNELVSLTNQLKLIYDYLNGYDAQAAYTEKDYYCPVNTERLRWMMKKVVSHASIF